MKHPVMRTIVAVIGGLFALGALALAVLRCYPPAAIFALWAAIFLVGLLIERWRYKPLVERSPGPDWQRTDERFVDPETGKLVTVYFHPATGERRYRTGAADSRLTRNPPAQAGGFL